MLLTLHIENIAAVEKADIEFRSGLNILTGETGAGKSIVIDSLEAALGWRTSRELVRTGADSALVTAVFTAEGTEKWCAENDIDASDGEIVLTRRINADGRTSCRVNGMPVSAAQTKLLGLSLIDIHGQGDGQKLLDDKSHLGYLDGFAELGALLDDYTALYRSYCATKRELEELERDSGERERRIDMLRYQTAEIESANLVAGEYDEKQKRREFLKNAGKLTSAVNDAFYALFGGDRADGALDCIGAAEGALSKVARVSEEIGALSEKLTELRYAAEDAAEEVRAVRDSLDFSPEELDEIESRLDTVKRIVRKYGGSEEAALEFLEKSREELEKNENSDANIARLKKLLAEDEAKAEKAAAALSAARKKAASELEKRIETELHDLSMPGAVFKVDVADTASLTAAGRDAVRFKMSANLGEAPGAIDRIASGGELSRIMLAMKVVLASGDSVPVMVFDEIDSGVSGIAAQRVAAKLAVISRGKQVLCVTHLPQIAVMADTQYCVVKHQLDGRTYTGVTELDGEGRIKEIARLTGGDNITDITLASAAEQLATAEKYRKEL